MLKVVQYVYDGGKDLMLTRAPPDGAAAAWAAPDTVCAGYAPQSEAQRRGPGARRGRRQAR